MKVGVVGDLGRDGTGGGNIAENSEVEVVNAKGGNDANCGSGDCIGEVGLSAGRICFAFIGAGGKARFGLGGVIDRDRCGELRDARGPRGGDGGVASVGVGLDPSYSLVAIESIDARKSNSSSSSSTVLTGGGPVTNDEANASSGVRTTCAPMPRVRLTAALKR